MMRNVVQEEKPLDSRRSTKRTQQTTGQTKWTPGVGNLDQNSFEAEATDKLFRVFMVFENVEKRNNVPVPRNNLPRTAQRTN